MPTTVGTGSIEDVINSAYQRKTFFAENRFWVFFGDGEDIVYRTSPDGTNWSDSTVVHSGIAEGTFISVHFDGVYVHYAISGGYEGPLYYRKGTPQSNGTISWTAAEQEAIAGESGNAFESPSICTDSEGYPFISYHTYEGEDDITKVTKSSLNNGTWSTATDFPVNLGTIDSNSSSVIPLSGSLVYAIYFESNYVLGKLWDGSSFSTAESIYSDGSDQSAHSAVNEGDDVHFVTTNSGGTLIYIKRTYGVGWGATEDVATGASYTPVLSINTDNNDLYCFWIGTPTADHVYYRKRTTSDWEDAVDWKYDSGITATYYFSCSYKTFQGIISVLWETGSWPGPYNVRHDYLSLGPLLKTLYESLNISGKLVSPAFLTLEEFLNFQDHLTVPHSYFVEVYETLNLIPEVAAFWNPIKLGETLQISSTTSFGITKQLLEVATLSPLLLTSMRWVRYFTERLTLTPLRKAKPKKTFLETTSLSESIESYVNKPHETFKIEIYRDGLLRSTNQTDVEEFEFTKTLTDETGGGYVIFENSEFLDYREGDEIRIYYGSETTGLFILVFSGEVETAEKFWDEEEAEQKLKVSFLDWSKILLEHKITQFYPTVTNVNVILSGILDEVETVHDPPYPNERKINTNYVNSYIETRTVDFVGESIFDCLNKIAFLLNSEFYVDERKFLRFFPRTDRPLINTFSIDTFINYNYEIKEDLLVNTVDVYGHQNKPTPMPTADEPDPWSDLLTDWAKDQGYLFLDNNAVRAGDYSICNHMTGVGTVGVEVNLRRTIPAIDLTKKDSPIELVFAGKVVTGVDISSFPVCEFSIRLSDENNNLVEYPGEQAFDILKSYVSSSDASSSSDSSTLQTNSTSWICLDTISVSVPSQFDVISLNSVSDSIKNECWGYNAYGKITYQFTGGSEIPIGTFSSSTLTPTSDSSSWSDEQCTSSTSYDLVYTFSLDVLPNQRATLTRIEQQIKTSWGSSSAWAKVTIQFGSGSVYTVYEGYTYSMSYVNANWDGSWRGELGEDMTVRFWIRNGNGYPFWTCSRNKLIYFDIGTTDWTTKTYTPCVQGPIGTNLKVRFYYCSQTSNYNAYTRNRTVQYSTAASTTPKTLNEISIPVGAAAENEGKWQKLGIEFDWSKVNKIDVRATVSWRGSNLGWVRLLVDWLHFDKGKWFAKSSDTTSMSEPPIGYGVRFKEIFDDTIYSDLAALNWAEAMIFRYKDSLYYLRDAEAIIEEIENYSLGDKIAIALPETEQVEFYYMIRKMTFRYDDEEGLTTILTFERIT